MIDAHQIIKRPVITERATRLKSEGNQYVLAVNSAATKPEIKKAVEEFFKVKVLNVRTMNVKGKFRRLGAAPGNYRSSWKKSILTLAKGQEIKYLDESK